MTPRLPDTEGMPRLTRTELIPMISSIDQEVIEAAHRLYLAIMRFYHGYVTVLATSPMPDGLAQALLTLWRAGDTLRAEVCHALQEAVRIATRALLTVDVSVDRACDNARCALKRAQRVEEER